MNDIQEIKNDKEIIVIQSKTKEIIKKANSIVIKDEPSQKFATDMRSYIKKAYNNLEEKRKMFTAPILEAKRNIDEEFKTMTIPLTEATKVLDEKLLAYHRELQAKAEEEAKAKAIVNDKVAEDLGLPKVETIPVEVPNMVKGALGGTFIQKRWTFELINQEEVPDKYKMLDEVKINAAIRAGERDIKGLRIYQKEGIGGR